MNTELEPSNVSDRPINFLDYLEVIVKRRRLILCTTFAAAVISLGVSFLLPKYFRATAKVLPPQQNNDLSSAIMGQMAGGLSNLASGLFGAGTVSDLYAGMLQSETIKDALIDRFKLIDVYNQKYRTDTYNVLDEHVDITSGKKDGIISISVEDKDPARATEMANCLVEELERLSVRLNASDAGSNRAFLEKRIVQAKADLVQTEQSLKMFQIQNKSIDVSEQAKATIAGVGDLMAQLAAQQVQLATLQRSLTDSSQEVKTAQTAIKNLELQIASLEGKQRGAIPGVGSVPKLREDYVRLMREFKSKETLLDLLSKQFELMKLTEAKDVSSIQIIQRARVPDKKSRPKKSKIIISATALALFLSITLAFLLEYFSKIPGTERDRWARAFKGASDGG